MKLARPDIRHPRLVLAGSADGDDAGLVAALRRRGLHARWLPWDDPETLKADLVILRQRSERPEFLAWTARVPNLLNPPAAVAWNMGPRHLDDLGEAGLPVTPTASPDAALIFLGGHRSHAVSATSSIDADFELWDLGRAALCVTAQRLGISVEALLCARVDVVGEPGDSSLAGVDLVAPDLCWGLLGDEARADAQREFVLCVESALERLSLGPLSHRRP